MIKNITVLIFVMAVIFLAGCVKQPDMIIDPEIGGQTTAGPKNDADPSKYDSFDNCDCRWNRSANDYSFVETDNAYIGTAHFDCLLHYWDKQTGESGVLCGKPECDHTTADCGGMIFTNNSSLTYYGGKLWWIGRNFDEEHPLPNDQKKRGLWRMDPDGTNREYLGRALSDFVYGDNYASVISLHRGYVYLLTSRDVVTDGVPSVSYSVFRSALDDLESYEALISFSCAEEGSVISSSLWCVEDSVIAYYRVMREEDGNNLYSGRIYVYDIPLGKTELVFDGEDPSFSFYNASYYNGRYYFAGRKTETDADGGTTGIGVVYRLEGGKLVECFDFYDEDAVIGAKGGMGGYTSATISGGFARAHYKFFDKDFEVWYKDLETGETLYKGKWNLENLPGYADGSLAEWQNIGGDGECIVTLICFSVEDGICYSFVKYSFGETGMTETVLFSGNTR